VCAALIRDGHVAKAIELEETSDQAAIAKSRSLLDEVLTGEFDDFEVWDGTRVVYARQVVFPLKLKGAD
jgi:hypothetical protein